MTTQQKIKKLSERIDAIKREIDALTYNQDNPWDRACKCSADAFGVDFDAVKSRRRSHNIAMARRSAMCMLMAKYTAEECAKFSGFNRTAFIFATKHVSEQEVGVNWLPAHTKAYINFYNL